VLGEELVVYRDRCGHLGVVDKYCPHRRASLAYGVVEADGIRCQYHGWKFDASGRCVDQPFEDTTHPEDNYRDKCGIRAYKAEELGGLIFVYMGPEPAPLLPRWGPLVWDNAVRDIAIAHLPCSWLQCQENSLDPTHVEHLHGYAGRYFQQVLAGEEPDFQRSHRVHTMIGFDAFKYGIIKRRVVVGQDENHAQWRLGHPILFRKMLLEQVNLVHAGQEPTMNIIRGPAENAELDFPVIPNEAGEWGGVPRGGNFAYHPQEAGYSRDADKIEAVMATWKDRAEALHSQAI
jgi:5,5'-dehydrodivanillate O-demethylase